MASQALLRKIAQLRSEVEALKKRKEPVAPSAPTLEELREALRILIDVGAVELDNSTLRWKKHHTAPTVRR